MRFIIGASGSGKTTFAYKKIIESSLKEKEAEFIILVPEQYTMQTQKDIAKLHPFRASLNIDVTSFNRLAYRVFKELGIKCPDILDDIAKAIIIRKLALENIQKLSIWKKQFSKPGFIDEMKSMISELYQYGINIENIINIKDNVKAGNILNQKLEDLEVIYDSFREFIARKYITAEEIPNIFYDNIHRSRLIKNSYILLDGFTGFTPVQYKIIDGFLDYSKGVECTVCIGSGEENLYKFSDTELFAMGKTIIKKIGESAAGKHIETEIHDLNKKYKENELRPRFKAAAEIDFLERHFLRYDRIKSRRSEENIKLIKAVSTEEEVSAVCSNILHLVKEEAMRYKDIAVITAEPALYSGKIKKHFELNNIPYFMDKNISLEDNALVEFIRAAFLLMSSNYSYDAVMRYIRTGFVCSDLRLESLMDNYMLACGIRGYKKMKSSWDYLPYSLEGINLHELNEFKDNILNGLEGFHKLWHKRKFNLAGIFDSFILLMESLEIRKKMSDLSELFEAEGLIEKAREYEEAYAAVLELFEKIKNLLEDEAINKNELIDIIDAGLGEIRVGIIPAKVDRVIIGDLKRSRLANIKALFIIGANDDAMPKLKNSQSIFNDREKESLKALGMELSATAKEDLFVQRFYIYMYMTKPSRYLYISYAGADSLGKASREASFLAIIRRLFSGLEIKPASEFIKVYSQYSAKQRLITLIDLLKKGRFSIGDGGSLESELKKLAAIFDYSMLKKAALYKYDDTEAGNKLEAVTASEIYEKKSNNETANEKNIITSVTRLEKYVSCPYAFFIKYGLGIKKRQIYSFEAIDIGTLVHRTIELVFASGKKYSNNIAAMKDEERAALVEKCAAEALLDNLSGIYNENARNEYLVKRLVLMAKQSVNVLAYQLKQGDFIPYEFEKSFNYNNGIKTMKIELERHNNLKLFLNLNGKVDRIDIYSDDDKVFAKIIDYKTGSTGWETDLAYYGSQMQLVVYLEAVKEMLKLKFPRKEVLPAAMLYFHIDDPVIEAEPDTGEAEIRQSLIKALRPSGLVNSDIKVIKHLDRDIEGSSLIIPAAVKNNLLQEYRSSVASEQSFALLGEHVKNRCGEIGKDMVSGKISINPSLRGNITACDYCEYRAVCGFDKKTPGYNYRRFKKLNSEEVFKRIKGDK